MKTVSLELAKQLICESHMCTKKAIGVEAYKGILLNLCKGHKKNLKNQKRLDNNQ